MIPSSNLQDDAHPNDCSLINYNAILNYTSHRFHLEDNRALSQTRVTSSHRVGVELASGCMNIRKHAHTSLIIKCRSLLRDGVRRMEAVVVATQITDTDAQHHNLERRRTVSSLSTKKTERWCEAAHPAASPFV